MRNIFFTSDQHYGHRNVIKHCERPFYGSMLERPWRAMFNTVSEAAVHVMNEELVRRHNAIVKPGDLTYHLGDFSLGKAWPEKILPRLNGDHILIYGNHDWVHPLCEKSAKKRNNNLERYRAAGFTDIDEYGLITIAGEKVLMHHMPYYDPNAKDQRYARERPTYIGGRILLHGHVHTAWKTNGRMINVGVDQWAFAPVSLEELVPLIKEARRNNT